MTRKILVLALAIAAASAVATVAFARHTMAPTLVGTDGPGYKITLTRSGQTVKTLKHGTYTFVIHDKSSIHGWSLDGPHGFAKDISAVPFTGTKTVTLKLKAGSYK